MKKALLFIILSSLMSYCFCQDNNTDLHNKLLHEKTDKLKSDIPYPKYDIGDTVYIAFIADPDIDSRYITEKDCLIKKVKIVGCVLTNGYIVHFGDVFSLPGKYSRDEKPTWSYQYLELSIKDPKARDFSETLQKEDRFGKTAHEALSSLLKH